LEISLKLNMLLQFELWTYNHGQQNFNMDHEQDGRSGESTLRMHHLNFFS